MKLYISSTILETALRNGDFILKSDIEDRELDSTIGDIFVDKDPSGGESEEEESSSEEEATEEMIIEEINRDDKFETKKEAYDALPESTKKVVDNKAKEHNEDVGSDSSKRTTAPTLAMVYWRGIGAYNTNPESVRPTVTSAEQWAIARINSFLYALRNGRFRSGKHDTDLLPKNHPMSSIEASNKSKIELRGLLDPENKLTVQELDMLITQLTSIKINAETIKMILEEFGHMPAWGESKINSISDTLAKLESYMLADLSEDLDRAVGDIDPTNFPKSGDDKKVSLRNSEYPLFDRVFADRIKEQYPGIWNRGGNVLGNKQYSRLTKILDQGGSIETTTDEEAVRLREAWAARHEQDFRLAGTIAQIKWLVIGERGEKYMKDLVREEMKKVDEKVRSLQSCPLATTNLRLNLKNRNEAIELFDYGPANPGLDELSDDTEINNEEYWNGIADHWKISPAEAKTMRCGGCAFFDKRSEVKDCIREGLQATEEEYPEEMINKLGYCRALQFKCREERTCVAWAVGGPITDETNNAIVDVEGNVKLSKEINMKENQMRCISEIGMKDGSRRYNLNGNQRIHFGIQDIDVRAFDSEDQEIDIEESLRAIDGRGRPAKYYSIEGIASSTSIDTYGTEMSYNALLEMQGQMQQGVPLLPRHTSRANGGMAEWDEVIGRTYEAEIRQDDVVMPADQRDKQYSLLVKSRLYGEDSIARELVKRLRRGEPIGQSIGGWFNDMEVITNSEDEIERVIIKSVTLDHLAITRAPANPDSVGLATYSKDSKELHNIISNWRSTMETESSKIETKAEEIETRSEETEEVEIPDLKTESESTDLPIKEPLQELNKDTSKVENRHISDMEETEDKYIITFDKAMMNMGGHLEEEMQSKMDEMIKGKIEEKMEEYMEEYMKKLMESQMMEFDELAKSEETEKVENRELDHSSVVEAPIMDNEDPNGGPGESVEDPNSIDDQFDHLQYREVMPFHDDLPLAAEDVPWSWNTTTQDEVLGEGLDNWDRYAMAHLYRDSNENPETKGAYKLPIALMINGELRVVWNGIRAAMSALNGARGGVDISDAEREAVYNTLSQYYAKFEKDIPELRADKEENQKEIQINENNVILSSENKKESSMNNEDMKNLAELIGRSINEGLKPLSERIEQLESRAASTMNETEEKATIETKEQMLPTDVQELRSIIEKQNELIARALQEPQRQGIHPGQMHRGIGATTRIEKMVERSAKEGYVGLSAVVKRHVDVLSEETEMSKLSVHQLKELLSGGLRAAEQDGLIG